MSLKATTAPTLASGICYMSITSSSEYSTPMAQITRNAQVGMNIQRHRSTSDSSNAHLCLKLGPLSSGHFSYIFIPVRVYGLRWRWKCPVDQLLYEHKSHYHVAGSRSPNDIYSHREQAFSLPHKAVPT